MAGLVESAPSRFDPVRRALQPFGFNQRLRADALEHLPISMRLMAGIKDGIRGKVLDA
jgi:hypothetical protein